MKKNKKHIILFSGGCGSAYTAYLVKKKYGKENIILLHTETHKEHKDTKRFMNDISDFLNIPITYFSDGRTLDELILQYKAMPSKFLPFCTQQLKQRQTIKFCNKLKKQKINFILHYGFGIEEYRRIQKTYARLRQKKIKTEFLLFETKIKNEDIKKIIINEWKICLPITYKILKHNNCLPCYKGGKAHFYKIWKYFNKEYLISENLEKQTNYTVFKDISLEQLRIKFENNQQLELFDDIEINNKDCICVL